MNKTIIYVVLGVVLLGGLFYFVMPKADPAPQANTNQQVKTFNLEVKNRVLVSGSSVLNVNQGDQVTINIISDEANELHVHGYDHSVEINKEAKAILSFTADVAGSFPFELHDGEVELGVVIVSPR